MKDALVLGAGMVGVGTALALQAQGFAVTLVDKSAPGRETSFGNAGIIQVEAVEPYELPRDPRKLARFALGLDNAVNYHPLALPAMVGPLWRYFLNSAPARHRAVSQHYARLVQRSLRDHAPLIAASGAEGLIQRKGYHQAYRTQKSFAAAVHHATRLQAEYGVHVDVLDSAALARAEPALLRPLTGALHWTQSWTSADPGALVAAYARLFESRGGHVQTADALSLARSGSGWAIGKGSERTEAAHAVVALGPWSPRLLRAFGLSIPMLGKRGYHRHFRLERPLTMPLYDTANAAVLCPMAQGLRITSGAELARMDAPATPRQLMKAEVGARQLLPLGQAVEEKPWIGVRPCMPDMLPVVGPVPGHKGLWANFGHGHQGFTLGPTTGTLLAAAMADSGPPVDAVFSPARWH